MIERALITGTSGFLGSYLARELLGRPEVGMVLSLSRSYHPVFSGRSRFHQIRYDGLPGEIARREIVDLCPEVIIHAAAMATGAACEKDPEGCHIANVELSRRILEIAGHCGAHVIYVSTDLVFDGSVAPEGGFTEEHTPLPVSNYSRTKRIAEEMFLSAPNASVARMSLLYGAPLGKARGPLAWMLDSLSSGAPTVLFRDEWRTPLYVEDAAFAAIELAMRRPSGIYHCGGPLRTNRVEMGETICDVFGFDRAAIVPKLRKDMPIIPPRPEDTSLSSVKLEELLGKRFDPPRVGMEKVREAIARGDARHA